MAKKPNLSAYCSDFRAVHAAEIDWINERRPAGGKLVPPATSSRGHEAKSIQASDPPVQGMGIAISGGGIRSAAFALGALQSLEQDLGEKPGPSGGIGRFDYLSTVSGGGYIGASLRVGMEKLGGAFPFSAQSGDKKDNGAIGHIRNHSRYLIPNGLGDLIGCLAVILRGLAANLLLILALLLFFAGMTGIFNPDQAAFRIPDFFGWEGFAPARALGEFGYTKLLLIVGFILLLLWGLQKSLQSSTRSEFRGAFYALACFWIWALAFAAFLELQPFAIRGLFDAYSGSGAVARSTQAPANALGAFANLVSGLSPYFASLAAIFAFVSRYFGDVLKSAEAGSGVTAAASTVAAKAAVLFMALALPLVLWVVYLHLTLVTDIGFAHRPEWMAVPVSLLCKAPDVSLLLPGPANTLTNWPLWVREAIYGTAGLASAGSNAPLVQPCQEKRLVGWLFSGVGLALFLLVWLYRPNANSLHRLYRDRLSRAFLFEPRDAENVAPGANPTELGDLPLTAIGAKSGPLHLINCALNVQGSKLVNRRGRNADFFFFSPVYSGSSSTGFVASSATPLSGGISLPDIGSAMAISGAAASSNMGANTVWGMAPTLALLNIRLGYWLDNPRHCAPPGEFQPTRWEKLRDSLKLYLASEMFSRLDERAQQIYLTDGGHIENLGLYELLRRRVKTIVVIDAEADPHMAFTALINVQRFARIDLGVRISLPWQAIRRASLAVSRAVAAGETLDVEDIRGWPHVAVGTIEYGDATGRIIYVKSSMTGDENDYVMAYKQRHPAFPHETTGDQFFSEEQFEAYRALGFHALHSAFDGKAEVGGLAGKLPPKRPAPDMSNPPAATSDSDAVAQQRSAAFKAIFNG